MNATPDRTLDDPQQTIADLKRQLAERTAERDEALEQQTATAEVLQVINSSPGNLTPVFDAMLEKATRLCEADFGILWSFDGELATAGALHRVPAAYADMIRTPFRPSPESGPARMMRGDSTFVVPDLLEFPPYHAGDTLVKAIVDLAGARTVVIAPLRKDALTIGAITVYRQEVRPFTKRQIDLLENFAAQAVIAMENARLITETREALEQQTATAEVLGVINASPGDLAPVFDEIFQKAMQFCGAAFGAMAVPECGKIRTVATRGVPAAYAEFRQRNPTPPTVGSVAARILAGEAVVHTIDMKDDLYATGDPIWRALVDLGGARTSLVVSLKKEREVLGGIQLYRQEVRPFSEKEIALVQNFAAQAVIAMENARLITETREALEQQTATAEVLQVINSSPGDLAPVFEALLDKALALCGGNFGFIRTYDGEAFHLGAMRGAPPELMDLLKQPRRPPFTGTALERMLSGEAVVQVTDIADEPGYRNTATARAMVAAGAARTMLWVALRKAGALLGFISVFRSEIQPFTDKQIALLQNFAAQAVIAMENARLLTETREALEQQTATAEVLQVINSSPGDLAPVFDAMLDKAMRLCEAAFGLMRVSDDEEMRTVSTRGVPVAFADFTRLNPAGPGQRGIAARIRGGEAFAHVSDLKDDDLYRNGDPQRRAAVDLGGARTMLSVALKRDRDLLGTIHLYRQEVRPFSDKQIALMQNFAAQAVIAMENARLITETREALEQQTATAEVLQVINSSPGDLAPVFEAMLEKAMRLCGAAFGMMALDEGEQARTVAALGVPAEFAEFRNRNPMRPNQAGIRDRLQSGESVVQIADMKDDDLYRSGDAHRRALVDLGGARTCLAVALRRDRDFLGGILIYRQEVRLFSDKQIALLQNFAAQAVIAMENARLLGELHQRTDEVAELNRGLEARVAEQVDELGRVGRLKRFLAPQLAEMIVSQGDEKILESHRREIVVVFCDLRGYTAFTETAEPEEVLDFLREYHGALGPLVSQFEGTLDQFSGDGIMVFFNDPVPIPDPAERAVKMAIAMRETAGTLIAAWRRRGRMLGFGAGIAQGYATLGQIGFSERSGYTAIGTVCNVAARLCAEAKDGQILVAQRVAVAVEERVPLEEVGELTVKGLTQPVVAYNVPLAAIQPALRVIEGGSPETV